MASKKTPAKKTPAKKTPAKKTPAKKIPAKKIPATGASVPAHDSELAKIDDLIVKSARGGGVASDARTALQALSDDVVGPRYVLAAKSANPKVRAAAVEGGTVTPRRRELFPLAAITACLDDVEAKVRLAALTALNRGWGPKHEAVYAKQKGAIRPALEPRLDDSDKVVAKQAAVVWARLGLPAPNARE
jgi:hypothetical protein